VAVKPHYFILVLPLFKYLFWISSSCLEKLDELKLWLKDQQAQGPEFKGMKY
jgi:hypothetical protein